MPRTQLVAHLKLNTFQPFFDLGMVSPIKLNEDGIAPKTIGYPGGCTTPGERVKHYPSGLGLSTTSLGLTFAAATAGLPADRQSGQVTPVAKQEEVRLPSPRCRLINSRCLREPPLPVSTGAPCSVILVQPAPHLEQTRAGQVASTIGSTSF